jgi:hypothetical protein
MLALFSDSRVLSEAVATMLTKWNDTWRKLVSALAIAKIKNNENLVLRVCLLVGWLFQLLQGFVRLCV